MHANSEARRDDVDYDGDRYAAVYDTWYENRLNTDSAVAFLRDLAPSGRALELGIGTGRIAIPLAACGPDVTGIDSSPAMLGRLAAKVDGGRVVGVLGDMGQLSVPGPFDLVYVTFSSLFLLTSQEAQLRCFRQVGSLLAEAGSFVVEAFVPDPTRYQRHQSVSVEDLGAESARFELAEHDAATQTISATRVQLGPAGIRLFPYKVRYATPAELDLMAVLAGLTLRERLEDFDRRPFCGESRSHVTVYVRASGDAAT